MGSVYLEIYTNQETIFGEIEGRSEKMNGVHCVSLPAPSLSHLMYAMEVVREAIMQEKCIFFNIVQKAFDPHPPFI